MAIQQYKCAKDPIKNVYLCSNEVFGGSVANGFEPSRYFLADIKKDHSRLDGADSKIDFHAGVGKDGNAKLLPQLATLGLIG